MDEAVKQWRAELRYLPKFLRDFHDQKDTFKALHTVVAVENHEYAKGVNWIVGQCYVIDIFLWHMARHGYVLRRAAAKLPFDDIEATNTAVRDRMQRLASNALGLVPATPAGDVEAFARDLRRWWSFDDSQKHTHTWHEREDFIRDRLPYLIRAVAPQPATPAGEGRMPSEDEIAQTICRSDLLSPGCVMIEHPERPRCNIKNCRYFTAARAVLALLRTPTPSASRTR